MSVYPRGPPQDLPALFPSQRGSRAITLEPGTDVTRRGPQHWQKHFNGKQCFPLKQL